MQQNVEMAKAYDAQQHFHGNRGLWNIRWSKFSIDQMKSLPAINNLINAEKYQVQVLKCSPLLNITPKAQ